MSQQDLGDLLGVKLQAIQRYERGTIRIGASRLYELSRALQVPIAFFFDDAPAGAATPTGNVARSGTSEWLGPSADNLLNSRETLELVRAYNRISDRSMRKRVFALIVAMGTPVE